MEIRGKLNAVIRSSSNDSSAYDSSDDALYGITPFSEWNQMTMAKMDALHDKLKDGTG